MKKKTIALLLIITICCLLCINSSALSYEEIENYIGAAVIISSFCGPVYPLSELLQTGDSVWVKSIPTWKEQYEKYKSIIENNEYHYSYMDCSCLTLDELKNIVYSVFSDELADYYLSKMFSLKNRAGDPVYREVDGLIYDLGDYGDPGGTHFLEINYTSTGSNKYSIHIKYSYGWDLYDGSKPPVLEDDLVLMQIDGTWKFTSFVSLNDRAYLSVYPDQVTLYPDDWINPNTSDSAVYITAAAGVAALCLAVVCRKKLRKI